MLFVAGAISAMGAMSAWADTVTAVSGTTLLTGMACSTSSACIATGQAGSQSSGVVVPIKNGAPGGVESVAGTNELYAAACSSSTSCVAVGTGNVASEGVIVPVTNGLAGGALAVSATAFLRGVACPTSTTCVAVGWETGNYNNGAGRIGVVVPITSGTPGGAQQVPGTLDVLGVACPTSTSCVGVGTAPSSPGSRASVIVPITNGAAGGAATVSGVDLDGVACPTSSECLAVGGTGSGSAGVGAVVVPITNGAPGAVESAQGITNLAGAACPDAATCEAVGWWTASNLGGVVSITNGTPTAAQPEPATFQLYGVACTSGTSCLAAGDNSSSGYGVVVSFVPSVGAGAVQGPFFTQAKRAAQADLPAALSNAIAFCTPTAVGLGTFGTGVLLIGSAAPLAIAGALTAYATTPFCLATIKRVLLDYRRYLDPPDPNYMHLANPAPIAAVRMPSCRRWRARARAFCAQLSRAEGKWVRAAELLGSVDQALETTVARESAAIAAHDQAAVNLQDAHIPGLEQQARSALKAEISAGHVVAKILKAHHVAYRMNTAQSGKIISAVRRKLTRQGITAAHLKQLVGARALRPRAINILAVLANG